MARNGSGDANDLVAARIGRLEKQARDFRQQIAELRKLLGGLEPEQRPTLRVVDHVSSERDRRGRS